MKNENHHSKSLMMGLLVGGTLGAALYLVRASRSKEVTPLQKIGHSICEIGEMLENTPSSKKELSRELEKKFPTSTDIVSTVAEWVDSGIKLWKTMKK